MLALVIAIGTFITLVSSNIVPNIFTIETDRINFQAAIFMCDPVDAAFDIKNFPKVYISVTSTIIEHDLISAHRIVGIKKVQIM